MLFERNRSSYLKYFISMILTLMVLSLLTLSSTTNFQHTESEGNTELSFFTLHTKRQFYYFILGWITFFFSSRLDFRYLRQWTWLIYLGTLFLLGGLFFSRSIAGVHRWYILPGLFHLQPSEFAKGVLILLLSYFFDTYSELQSSMRGTILLFCLLGAPFLLIAKQPDLGTALTLCPIAWGLMYCARAHKTVLSLSKRIVLFILLLISAFSFQWISHEKMRPYCTLILREYQYNRLLPESFHLERALTALSIGGLWGSGWRKSLFTGMGYLPESYKDAIFAAFGEEYGLIGMIALLALFYGLISFCFFVANQVKEQMDRYLSLGVGIHLATHVILNVGMMIGFFPITGVPLPLFSFGGSSIIATMSLLGLVYNVYRRHLIH